MGWPCAGVFMSYSTLDTQDHPSGYDANPSVTLTFSEPFTIFSDHSHPSIGSSVNYELKAVESTNFEDIDLVSIVQGASHFVRDTLREFALSSTYDDLTGVAFGENYDRMVSEDLRQRFVAGDLAHLPHIQVLDASILNHANGTYASELNTIFLSDAFVSRSSQQAIAKVLLEEIGHFIDDQINQTDSPGDEGDIFARLVLGQDLCLNELAYLRQEDDSGYIVLNGQFIAIEQDNTLSTAYNVGTLSGSRNVTGWVGSTDYQDYYRFYVGTTSNFRLNLTGLSADADVQLLNSAGSVVQGSYWSGTGSELISRQLGAGTYYARVYQYSGNTNYNLSLNATPLDYAGNSLSTARNIGTLSGTRSFTDWVGNVDTNDYYRFYVGTTSNFRLNLTRLSANANVQLLNSAGTVVQSSTLSGNNSELIARQLAVGTYYARVYPFSGNTNYSLTLNATAIPLDNTLSTARNLGNLVGTRSFTDWVGSSDTTDYYRFNVGTTSNFRLNLTGLSADANVRLLNSAGSVLQGSYLTGNSSESISRQLGVGTYYAQVYRASGDTNYSLSLNATPLDYAGNTLSTARNIGTLSGTRSFTDWVGSVDTNDYYRFYVGTASNFRLNLTGLSKDANVQLLNSAGSVLQSSTLVGTSSESISRELSAGNYYARVYRFSGDTTYNLALSATAISPEDWYNQNLRDSSIRSLTRSLAADSSLSRNDMISILRDAKDGGIVDATELTDLRTIVANPSRFAMQNHVRLLSNNVVNSNTANQWWTGGAATRQTLGNLFAGSSATQMERLIGKWFLGTDLPTAFSYNLSTKYNYRTVSGSLFQNGVSYQDVRQGNIGNCYFVNALAGAAFRTPSSIQNMFIDNGDGTFTVRFFNNSVANYVTVNRQLPTNASGYSVFASWGGGLNTSSTNELWVALAEKAYAQINEAGWIGQDNTNSYQGLNGGWSHAVLRQISNQSSSVDWTLQNDDRLNIINQFNAGKTVFMNWTNPEGGHALLLTGYNAITQQFSIYNPWGNTYSLSWQQVLYGGGGLPSNTRFASWSYSV